MGLTFLLMLLSWVLFRANDLGSALNYFQAMFGWQPPSATAPLLAAVIHTPYHWVVLAICAVLVWQPVQAHDWAQRPVTWPRAVFLVPVFALSLAVMISQDFNPFLYFQF